MIVKLVLTITILSVEVTKGEENDFSSILESKNSFFYKINANVHNAVNQIFNCLRLLKYFSKSDQNELLLKMHNDFLNIAEKNYAVYEHLRNTSNTNFTMGDYRSKFLESLNEVIKEETTKHKHARNKTLNNAKNNTEPEKSDESLEFLDEFVNKFSKLTVENLTNHKINETNRKGIVKLLIKSKNYELKAWNSTILNGTPSNLTRRLYRGKDTKIGNYPFLVSIHILNDFMCSGSIIKKDLVITAASCLQIAYNNRRNPRSVFVRVGSDYTKSYGQLIPVTEIYLHPKYDPQTLKNNIAIIRIQRQLNLSLKTGRIRRIKYKKEIRKQTDGVYVLGWGAQNPKHNPNNLKKLAVDYLELYSFSDCQEIYTSHYVTNKNFCAGFINVGAGACNRDVGGPGFRDGTLVGIISFGPPVCGMPNSPTVFTNIGYYGTWIDSIVRQKPPLKILNVFRMPTRTVKIAQKAQTTHLARTLRTGRSRSLSNKIHTTPFTTRTPPKVSDDYPEEVKILKEMLQEIVMTNSSMVDYILYGGNVVDKTETAKAHNYNNNFQVYNEKTNNNNNLRHSKTTGMYSEMMAKQDTTRTYPVYNNYYQEYHESTEMDITNVHRFIDMKEGPLYNINDIRQKNNYIDNTPAGHIYNVKDESRMTSSDDNESTDVSENYEEQSDHEHEIAIDTNDIELKNISFLDALFNLQQYQESHFPNMQNNDKNKKDRINFQLFVGPELRIDTTPERLSRIDAVEPETETYSDDDDDEKHIFREKNGHNEYYNNNNKPISPWQKAKDLIKQGSIINKQYEINFKRKNLSEQMKHNILLGIPRAN